MRIDPHAAENHFEMQVRPGGIARRSAQPDRLSAVHDRAAKHVHLIQVGVNRLPIVSMVDYHQIPVTPGVPSRIDHNAAIGGADGSSMKMYKSMP